MLTYEKIRHDMLKDVFGEPIIGEHRQAIEFIINWCEKNNLSTDQALDILKVYLTE